MGNKATQPRSFNTIRRSQTKVRAQRRQTQRVVLLAMFATVALILVSLLVLGGFAIVNAIIDARPAPDNNDNNPPSPNGIQFIQTTKFATDTLVGDLVLVNPDNRYTFPDAAEKTLECINDYRTKAEDGKFYYTLVEVQYKLKLQKNAIDALNAMLLKSYEVTGDIIKISEAHRTLKAQEGRDIEPGYSDHHTGYCFAIRDNADSSELDPDHWIYENCHKYGFVVRYPEGKEDITEVSKYTFCLRYVGVPHATYIYENDLCLEEYLDLLKNSYSSAATRLTISAADGFEYDVYYVKASDAEVTTIDVPTSNFDYTVSGDNRGGFIVTVKKPVPLA